MNKIKENKPKRGIAISILIFAGFMDLIDSTIVNVALPSIQHNINATSAALEWIVSGYLLAFAALLIIGGRLGDIFGRQRLFLIGIAGFTLASLACAVSPNSDMLIVSRILQGGFAALMVPQSLSTVQALFKPKERGPIFGILGASAGIAAAVGPVLGGWLVSSNFADLAWRPIFLINVPIGILIFILGLLFVPNTKSQHPLSLDLIGTLLATSGVVAVIYPLIEGRQLDWPLWIYSLFALAVVLFIAFARYEIARQKRTASALVPMELFRDRGFSAGTIAQLSSQSALLAFVFILTLYLQLGLHFSALRSGLTFLAFSIGSILGTGAVIPLLAKLGKVLVFSGAIIQAAGILWFMSVIQRTGADLGVWDAVWPLFVSGIGFSAVVIPLVDVALAKVPHDQAGAASGTFNTFQQIGAALGVAIVGVVFFHLVGTNFSQASLQNAFIVSAWTAIIAYGILAVSSLFLPKRADVEAHLAEEKLV